MFIINPYKIKSRVSVTSSGLVHSATGPLARGVTTSLAVTLPANAAGDYMFLCIQFTRGFIGAAPTGWTEVMNMPGWATGAPGMKIYRKISTGAEPSTVAVTNTNAKETKAVILTIQNATGEVAGTAAKQFSVTNISTTSLTATANSAIIHMWSNSVAEAITIPGTPVTAVASDTTTWGFNVAIEMAVSAGATTARNGSWTTASNGVSGQLEVLA